MRTSWTRLIRFVAAETKREHFGQPLDDKLDIGIAYHNHQTIQAYEVQGDILSTDAKVTDKVLTVKELLMPLRKEQIGIVRCLGLNYADHAKEANLPEPPAPILFYKPITALIGPEQNIHIPQAAQPVSKHVPDYEVELSTIIGQPCKDVSESDALDYVLGYCTGNDTSFRYHQMLVSQWGFSKGFGQHFTTVGTLRRMVTETAPDHATPLGPCIVAASVVKDPQTLSLSTTLNGEVMQDGNTSDQIFDVRQTIAFLSQGTTLEPGSVIMTGTPKGVGFVRRPPVYLKDGDDVRVSIGGGLGTLINRVEEIKTKGSKL